ncbi:MAG: hypothetical protein ACR2NK_07460 [Mariniblastus sp.]
MAEDYGREPPVAFVGGDGLDLRLDYRRRISTVEETTYVLNAEHPQRRHVWVEETRF